VRTSGLRRPGTGAGAGADASAWRQCRAGVALLILLWFSAGASGQERQTFPRADGAAVPARVFRFQGTTCRGVAVVSHGAGGSEDGMKYLAEALSRDGWLAIVVGHLESGEAALRASRKDRGLKDALLQLTTERAAYEARWMDLGAALDWSRSHCGQRYRALIGHSMGAATAMLEAGAGNRLKLKGADRFDSYVALSPQGRGAIFTEAAWGRIKKPVLLLTGTRDDVLEGTWKSRTLPYDTLPAGCAWLGVIDGATHMNFAGVGLSRKTETLTIRATLTFLDALAAGGCGAPPEDSGIVYRHK
jgi:dienelactone hydrolase